MGTIVTRMSDRRLILFAPGAGAPSTSTWMKAWQKRLSELGTTVPFDYPCIARDASTRSPFETDRGAPASCGQRRHLARRRACLCRQIDGIARGVPRFAEEPNVRALVCFGYPLKGRARSKRSAMKCSSVCARQSSSCKARAIRSALSICSESVRAKMQTPSTLHVVHGGDHSLVVSAGALKAAGKTQADSDARVLEAVPKASCLSVLG